MLSRVLPEDTLTGTAFRGAAAPSLERAMPRVEPTVNTFSIVARDPATGDLGVAVESKFLAVGAVVPWARAGVGAVATQAHTNTRQGPAGLALLEQGATAQEALDTLLARTATPAARQLGVVDAPAARPATPGRHAPIGPAARRATASAARATS